MRQTQAAAAREQALRALRQEVLAEPLKKGLTVGQFLQQAGGPDGLRQALRETLAEAQQIGGPRWSDDQQTCHVRLELAGAEIARALQKAAAAHPEPQNLPLSPEALRQAQAQWEGRTFSAVGGSTTASAVERFRPDESNAAWQPVSDADRRDALAAARDNLVESVRADLADIPLADGKTTAADALKVAAVREALRAWLVRRPVVGVEFGEDLQVRLAVAAPPEGLWRVFRAAAARRKDLPLPADEAGGQRLRDQFVARVGEVVGVGKVPAGKAAQTVFLPAEPPPWVGQWFEASGKATAARRRPGRAGRRQDLLAARHAEDQALRRLRSQLDDLPLTAHLTLGQAAGRDARIAESLDRCLDYATTSKIAYRPNGVVEAHVGLDTRNVWYELRDRP